MNQIVTAKELALDAAQADRRAAVRPRDTEPRTLFSYIGGALITCGWYGAASDAKGHCPHVGQWFELGENTDNWRSADGRTLILGDYRAAPPAPAYCP